MPEPHGILRRRVSENPEGLRHAVKDGDRVCRRGRKPNAEPEPRGGELEGQTARVHEGTERAAGASRLISIIV
ncbi:hypothetical protein BCR44DRAFT_1441988, partial [Catenaria anguillulae PL171]